jgi:hypothetical protein
MNAHQKKRGDFPPRKRSFVLPWNVTENHKKWVETNKTDQVICYPQ